MKYNRKHVQFHTVSFPTATFRAAPSADEGCYGRVWFFCVLFILSFLGATLPGAAQTVSPASLSFGNQAVGTTSASKNVTVTNKGKSGITITSIATNLSDYAQTNNCPLSPATLPAGTSCTISVTFTPGVIGARDGTLTVTDSGTQSVSLKGTGELAVTAAPSSLNFGNEVVGKKSASKSATIKNNQPTSLTISSIATNSSDYSITADTCPISPATLAGGASCKITLTFTPSILGSDNATLTITDNASNSPTVSLTGTGVPPVAVAPSSLVFGSQALGTTSLAQVVTLANNQSSKLTITSTTSSLADFALSSTCPLRPSTLAAGASCSVSVTFSPAATGTRSATLTFSDNASNSPQTVSLSGTGLPATLVSIAVTPANSSVIAGTTEQFTATGTYTDNSTQNLTNSVTWTTANSGVATMNAQGLATGVAAGSTTVTATSGTISGSAGLNVTPAVVVSIAVTPANPSVAAETAEQFTATGTYTDNSTQNLTNDVTWASSNTTVATVSAGGLATTLTAGLTTVSATSGSIVGSTLLTVTAAPPILSRVPERVCVAENETSTSSSCVLSASIASGDGLVVFITSVNGLMLAADALQDSAGNAYTLLSGPVSGGYGSIYMGYAQVTSALNAGNTINVSVPGSDSWGLTIYDIGPVASNAADVGVTFQNAESGPTTYNNPATGVPGWWTGLTAATTGSQDICMAALGVGPGSTGNGPPQPITTFSANNNFTELDMSQFYTQSDPAYPGGGAVLTMYSEAPAGSTLQSNVTTSDGIANTAPSAMYCFKEGAGAVTQIPWFTGNSCTAEASCTLSNVSAGDMLVITAHTFVPLPGTPITVSDSLGESVTFDQINGGVGLGTWHISPVVIGGSHTISVDDAVDPYLVINVAEISGQASGNPVEAMGQNSFNSSSQAFASLTTITPNDLLFGWARSFYGTDEGQGFTGLRVTPTAEYATAPAAGPQTVSVLPQGTPPWTITGIQAIAIRPAGTTQPPASAPQFSNNYCTTFENSSCTISNVTAGDILVISSFSFGTLSGPLQVTDSMGETFVADQVNQTDGFFTLSTWHIAAVANAGTHTISVDPAFSIAVSEYTGQSQTNPIDSETSAIGLTGGAASSSLSTSQGNDLIYAWCGTDEVTGWGDGFAAIVTSPTAEFRAASTTPGTETATCSSSPLDTSAGWVVQELAIRH